MIVVVTLYQASRKKDMIRSGLLDKHGKVNEKTPVGWQSSYKDFRYAACELTDYCCNCFSLLRFNLRAPTVDVLAQLLL